MEKIDARKLPREVLEHIRRQAFGLRERGYTWAQIADVCGVHVGTVRKWSRRANRAGLDAAIQGGRRGRREGSGRTLTPVQEELLILKIMNSRPSPLGLDFVLWSRRAVMQAIRLLFGIEMPVRTVGEYLRRWGFLPDIQVHRAPPQESLLLQAWLRNRLPEISGRARAEHGEVYWYDETCVERAGSGHAEPLRSIMLSATANQGLVRFSFAGTSIGAGHFTAFLEGLVHDAGHKVFLIVGKQQPELSAAVTGWLASHSDRIELFWLPQAISAASSQAPLDETSAQLARAASNADTELLSQEQEYKRLRAIK